MITDSAVLGFGADKDTTLTHTDGTGLTLNSTNKLCFNDASQYIQGASNAILDIAATDEIELTATLVDVNANLDVSGTYTGAGLMTTGGNIVIPNAGNIGSASDTDAIAIASNGVTTFSQAPVFPDGSLALADLDIDGGTDIGAAIVDADLFIIDDGAGGTNRKVTASRIATYIGDNNPSFFANQAATQTIGNGSQTKVTLGTEIWDVGGNFGSDKFTVPTGGAGKYVFHFGGYLVSVTTNGYFQIALYKNGSRLTGAAGASRVFMATSLAQSHPFASSCMTVLADDDYIEMYVYQNNQDGGGGDRVLGDANHLAYMSGFKLIGV